METLVIARNVCNLYARGAKAEVVTQAILGQRVRKLSEDYGLIKVSTADLYKGRIAAHNLCVAAPAPASSRVMQVCTLFAPVHVAPDARSELVTTLVLSTVVAVTSNRGHFVRVHLPDGASGYVRKTHISAPVKPRRRKLDNVTIGGIATGAARVARRLVGTPYLWGGCTPYGTDCSGFVQLCYGMSGVQLLRDARLQVADRRFKAVGHAQTFAAAKLRAGDLVFFGEKETDRLHRPARVTHVGMILADGRMIHAAGGYGVVIEERNGHRCADQYLGARRLRCGAAASITMA